MKYIKKLIIAVMCLSIALLACTSCAQAKPCYLPDLEYVGLENFTTEGVKHIDFEKDNVRTIGYVSSTKENNSIISTYFYGNVCYELSENKEEFGLRYRTKNNYKIKYDLKTKEFLILDDSYYKFTDINLGVIVEDGGKITENFCDGIAFFEPTLTFDELMKKYDQVDGRLTSWTLEQLAETTSRYEKLYIGAQFYRKTGCKMWDTENCGGEFKIKIAPTKNGEPLRMSTYVMFKVKENRFLEKDAFVDNYCLEKIIT